MSTAFYSSNFITTHLPVYYLTRVYKYTYFKLEVKHE